MKESPCPFRRREAGQPRETFGLRRPGRGDAVEQGRAPDLQPTDRLAVAARERHEHPRRRRAAGRRDRWRHRAPRVRLATARAHNYWRKVCLAGNVRGSVLRRLVAAGVLLQPLAGGVDERARAGDPAAAHGARPPGPRPGPAGAARHRRPRAADADAGVGRQPRGGRGKLRARLGGRAAAAGCLAGGPGCRPAGCRRPARPAPRPAATRGAAHPRDVVPPQTRLILMSHIVNITGQIMPVKDVVAMARRKGDPSKGGIPVIVDELGIEPSEALQELERAILRHDAVLEPRPAPMQAAGATAVDGDSI